MEEITMIKICVQAYNDANDASWIAIPNGDIDTAISDVVGDRDWRVSDLECELGTNSFISCDIKELNAAILELEEYHHFDSSDVSNLSVLNMLLEDRHHNVEEVKNILINAEYHIYRDVESIADVAREYLENTSVEYSEMIENDSVLVKYIDFQSYGEEVLEAEGTWLFDKENKLILEVLV
jgi:hypothetical protein